LSETSRYTSNAFFYKLNFVSHVLSLVFKILN
jgi:hypothetical protein